MSANRERVGSFFSTGAFWIGMGFILAAPIMNLAYDRMSKNRLKGDGSEMLPSFLATMYDGVGTMGVTLALIATGAVILAFGQWQQSRKSRLVENVTSSELEHNSSTEESAETTASGHMILQTQKYLT